MLNSKLVGYAYYFFALFQILDVWLYTKIRCCSNWNCHRLGLQRWNLFQRWRVRYNVQIIEITSPYDRNMRKLVFCVSTFSSHNCLHAAVTPFWYCNFTEQRCTKRIVRRRCYWNLSFESNGRYIFFLCSSIIYNMIWSKLRIYHVTCYTFKILIVPFFMVFAPK